MRQAWRWALLAPAMALVTGACFATRSDVRVLQGDLLTLRTEAARADSARARQIASIATTLGVLVDSMRATRALVARFQGDTRGEMRGIQQQLLQIQELTGQSQRRLQELRAELEARAQQPVAPPPSAPLDTAAARAAGPPAAPGQPAAPGPNQLYQLAYDQLRRASYGAARAGFEELVRLYPTSELAPDAQLYIAESYAAEGAAAQADAAYALVVANFPRSPKAATALYKLGLSYARQGKRAEARSAMERVVREYGSADDAELARDWLRTNR